MKYIENVLIVTLFFVCLAGISQEFDRMNLLVENHGALTDDLANGLFRVQNRVRDPITGKLTDKWVSGIVDSFGNTIIELGKYGYDIRYLNEGLISVQKDGKTGVVDLNGQLVIPTVYDDVDRGVGLFSHGTAVVRKNGKLGIIDKTGKIIIPPTYDLLEDPVPPRYNKEGSPHPGGTGYPKGEGKKMAGPTWTEGIYFDSAVNGL